MPTRRGLKGIAANITSSFVSRNNDIDGYWAIGKLYLLGQRRGLRQIAIDLLSEKVEPQTAFDDALTTPYRQMLSRNLSRAGFAETSISSASLTIVFEDRTENEASFSCSLSLGDDRGRLHSAAVKGFCRPHDPARELRRAGRALQNFAAISCESGGGPRFETRRRAPFSVGFKRHSNDFLGGERLQTVADNDFVQPMVFGFESPRVSAAMRKKCLRTIFVNRLKALNWESRSSARA